MDTSGRIETISASSITRFHSPFRELLGGGKHPLLPDPAARFPWEERFEVVTSRINPARSIMIDLENQNRKLGADEEVVNKIRPVFEGAGGIVVTGQQPGLFGGPLLTLYKALTAVELARRLEERFGVHVVPVFWNAVNDDDFPEVRTCTLVTPEAKPVAIEVPSRYHRAGMCVGSIPLGHLKGLLDVARTILERWGENGRTAYAVLAESFEAERWGEHFARILVRLFGGKILVYDAGSRAWACEGIPIAERFGTVRSKVLEALQERAHHMESIALEPTIPERTLEVPVTLIENGTRKRFGSWDDEAVGRMIEERPCDVYPNVALRSIYQDALFPVIAHVVGPGEMQYLVQISPLYEALEVPEPIRVPRLSLTLLSQTVSTVSEALGISRSDVFLDWAGKSREYVASRMPDGFNEAVDELSALVSRRGRELVQQLGPDAQLGRDVDRISELIAALKAKGEERLVQRFKRDGLDLSLAADFLYPRGALQERVLSCLVPVCAGGFELLGSLVRAAGEHLDRLDESGSGHVLMDLP